MRHVICRETDRREGLRAQREARRATESVRGRKMTAAKAAKVDCLLLACLALFQPVLGRELQR